MSVQATASISSILPIFAHSGDFGLHHLACPCGRALDLFGRADTPLTNDDNICHKDGSSGYLIRRGLASRHCSFLHALMSRKIQPSHRLSNVTLRQHNVEITSVLILITNTSITNWMIIEL
jgi:hypothetical protein